MKIKLYTLYEQYYSPVQSSEIKEKADNFDNLMEMIKQKIHGSRDTKTRLQLLTIPSSNWSISKVQEYFQARYILGIFCLQNMFSINCYKIFCN